MSNETLILKTAVATNSTVKLTDCPMVSGEILEMVCRLYANGLTSGNRCFKAIGNAVTYNTDAVTEGDIYCVSYRDGGFYVGARQTEDYTPQVGDLWMFPASTFIDYATYYPNWQSITDYYPTGFYVKVLDASDILAYSATGHMGWLILSDATLAFTKTGPYSSSRTAAYSENTVDVNAIYVLEVRINGQRAHITAAGLNYVYSDIGQKGNAPYELVDGLLIFNQTAKQYSDVNDYNVDNLLKGFYALTTLETASNTDTVTVYKYEVYQDNRPVALNSLNTNVQDEG